MQRKDRIRLLFLAYHQDYRCLSAAVLKLFSLHPSPRQLGLFEEKPASATGFYR